MLHLYIARHGQTHWNVEKRMQGWLDSGVTELGLYNARALGERLKDIEFNQVYISPSKRTEETAKAILGSRRLPLVKDRIFREMSLGPWEGKKQEDIERDDLNFFMLIFIILKHIASQDVKHFLTLKAGQGWLSNRF